MRLRVPLLTFAYFNSGCTLQVGYRLQVTGCRLQVWGLLVISGTHRDVNSE